MTKSYTNIILMTAILYTIDLLKGFYETYKKGGQRKDPLFDKKCIVLKFEIVAKFCHYAELVGAIVYPSYAANVSLKFI
jgi:hypothetical protein